MDISLIHLYFIISVLFYIFMETQSFWKKNTLFKPKIICSLFWPLTFIIIIQFILKNKEKI
jgi:hypothetical protein